MLQLTDYLNVGMISWRVRQRPYIPIGEARGISDGKH